MNTKQRITSRATELGYSGESTVHGNLEVVTFHSAGRGVVKMQAQFVGNRFEGGFVVDRMGHVVSCDTVTDLIRFAQ